MSGINEFNSPQPEQFDYKRNNNSSWKLIKGTMLLVITLTAAAAVGFTMKKITNLIDDPYGALIEQVASEIDLNEQQKQEIIKIKDDAASKIENREIHHVTGGKQIESIFRADNFDRSKALDVANLQDADNRDIAVYMVDQLEKVHNLLTSKQRNDAVDKIKTLYASFKKK